MQQTSTGRYDCRGICGTRNSLRSRGRAEARALQLRDGNFTADEAEGFRSFLQGAAASALSLKACEDDGIARVGQTLGEVMQYTSAGDHAAGSHDDARSLDVVDLLGFVGSASEMELVE